MPVRSSYTRSLALPFVGVTLFLACSPAALSASISWVSGTGFWDVGSNWSTAAPPTGSDDATIDVAGT